MFVNESVRVILAEDDEADALSFVREARKRELPANIISVSNGQAALQLLSEEDEQRELATIVVTDINMGELSGHELIDAIRTNPSLRHTVIFVVSSSNEQADIQQAYAQNVTGYVVKDSSNIYVEKAVELIKDFISTVSLPIDGRFA